jgi:hypothetical protein
LLGEPAHRVTLAAIAGHIADVDVQRSGFADTRLTGHMSTIRNFPH